MLLLSSQGVLGVLPRCFGGTGGAQGAGRAKERLRSGSRGSCRGASDVALLPISDT